MTKTKEIPTCSHCGNEAQDGQPLHDINGWLYCDDCTFLCPHCGQKKLAWAEVDGVIWCQECVLGDAVSCQYCGEYTEKETAFVYNGIHYCKRCESSNFTSCHFCGELLERGYCRNISSGGEEVAVCQNCYNERQVLKGYHGHDPEDFAPKKECERSKLRIGFELETETPRESDNNEICQKIREKDAERFLNFETDGSIEHGFEVISRQISFDGFKKHKDYFAEILKTMKEQKCRSYNTRTCGMHVHMSKKAFGNNQLYRFLKLFQENRKMIHKISQRTKTKLNQWASLDSDEYRIARRCKHKASSTRYTAVNMTNANTVEIRIFRGTLSKSSFFKNIEFCFACYYYSQETSNKNVSEDSFRMYIDEHKNDYPNLHEFLNRVSINDKKGK